MFNTSRAFSGFAVKDLYEAASFYGETLAIQVADVDGGLFLNLSDDHRVFIYPKPDHTPATYTILNFPVDDIDTAVDQLRDRGVQFERYEGFDQDEKGIARGDEGPPIAWFTDPSGNILSVLENG
jgi:predicted enzyme related to lactoylglutathione lyase